jgi:hypothetical protein
VPTGHAGRVYKDRVTLRFSIPEKAVLDEAVRVSPVAYKGVSYHLRAACLEWAGRMIALTRKGRRRHMKGQTAGKRGAA